jgi:uncharacterized protein (DUF1697 family)
VRYVALLRGINVGGKTLIKMADLKTCIEALGLDDVSTYIASGNVLFESSERDAAKLERKIERAVEQRFQLPVKVVVLDRTVYGQIIAAVPKYGAQAAGTPRGVNTRSRTRAAFQSQTSLRELHGCGRIDERCLGREDVVHVEAVLVEHDASSGGASKGECRVAGDAAVMTEEVSVVRIGVVHDSESACASRV